MRDVKITEIKPNNPIEGDIYYNTITKSIFIYSENKWLKFIEFIKEEQIKALRAKRKEKLSKYDKECGAS